MNIETNHSLSVDCVVFGFNGQSLKVLLVERKETSSPEASKEHKLPGSMIYEAETLPDAAQRVLAEATGLRSVYLKMTDIFSDPNRVGKDELDWINKHHSINTRRVVTVGYYALVKLDSKMVAHTTSRGAKWVAVEEIRHLSMDHKTILVDSLSALQEEMEHSPIAFELLPKKFTIRQLQSLYSAVLGIDIDNRNFRKKILGSGYLIHTGEKERGVAHKPAEFFTFNRAAYRKMVKNRLKLGFV